MTYTLVLLRHGESDWNAKNLFTGWVDVPLSEKGLAEASRGGELLEDARERKPDVPMHPLRSGGLAMVRYIGHPEPAENDAYLDEWAARIARWLAEGTRVYLFMHCPDEARSPALCRAIQACLEQLGAVPPLPWGRDEPPPAPPEQLRLF